MTAYARSTLTCPPCGGPLWYEHDVSDPAVVWLSCSECGRTFDLDEWNLTDEEPAA